MLKNPSSQVVSKPRVRHSFFYKNRGAIGVICILPLAVLALFSPPLFAINSLPYLGLRCLSWLFFFNYILFRTWASLYVGGKKDKELQTEGPYSMVRNPLYVGSCSFGLAVAFSLQSPLLLAGIGIGIFLYALLVIPVEEKTLAHIFGESYTSYLKSVPRLLPKWKGFHTSPIIEVRVYALKKEFVRLLGATFFFLVLHCIEVFRYLPWWPHYFRFSF